MTPSEFQISFHRVILHIHLLHALDLASLYETAELGHWLPFLLLHQLSTLSQRRLFRRIIRTSVLPPRRPRPRPRPRPRSPPRSPRDPNPPRPESAMLYIDGWKAATEESGSAIEQKMILRSKGRGRTYKLVCCVSFCRRGRQSRSRSARFQFRSRGGMPRAKSLQAKRAPR